MVELFAKLAEWIHTILSFKIGDISLYVLVLVAFIGAAIKVVIDSTTK